MKKKYTFKIYITPLVEDFTVQADNEEEAIEAAEEFWATNYEKPVITESTEN